MKCNICGKEITGFGNNPDPICGVNDTEARCCDACNNMVITARLIQTKQYNIDTKMSDEELTKFLEDKLIVIFYSNTSDEPTSWIVNNGKFLTGKKIEGGQVVKKKVAGYWGNFLVDLENDSYAIIDEI